MNEQAKPRTRVVESFGDPGKWQAQYYDGDMDQWFDIGDAQIRKADAELRETDYISGRNNGTCEAAARKGTGTGICDRPLDSHGWCDRADDHVEL